MYANKMHVHKARYRLCVLTLLLMSTSLMSLHWYLIHVDVISSDETQHLADFVLAAGYYAVLLRTYADSAAVCNDVMSRVTNASSAMT